MNFPSYVNRFRPVLLSALLIVRGMSWGQSTQGILVGRIYDTSEGTAIAGAEILCQRGAGSPALAVHSDSSGRYIAAALTPGIYVIKAAASGYQTREIRALELPVDGYLELDFRLRPLADVWEQGEYRSLVTTGGSVITFYGPDVERNRSQPAPRFDAVAGNLEATISTVIDGDLLNALPLSGRDAYSLLVLLPGVTADLTTTRSLGLSVNGQRPASSSFLLDGVENNNSLVTGPAISATPEQIQEYRISTHNFGAEFGGTAGYLANVVTRSPTDSWHGSAWWFGKNEALDANGFQQNRLDVSRARSREFSSGAQGGGRLFKSRWHLSGSMEWLRHRAEGDPVQLLIPGTDLLSFTAPGAASARLLTSYPAPVIVSGPYGYRTFRPPNSLDRFSAVPRIDAPWKKGASRLSARAAIVRMERPDFDWTPYQAFSMPLRQNTTALSATLASSLSTHWQNELRASFVSDDLRFDRPHPEIPTLQSGDGLVLPGSPAFYSYRNRTRSFEWNDNLQWMKGRHIWKAGGGVLVRSLDGYLTAGRDGLFGFQNYFDFGLSRPNEVLAMVARDALPKLQSPDYGRIYRNSQFSFFLQDSFRATPRLTLHWGLRYESFGVPVNTGSRKDMLVNLASGAFVSSSGDQRLYDADRNNWGPRVGLVYKLRDDGRLLARASWGLFYDRPFDNLWQNLRSNSYTLASFGLNTVGLNYLAPLSGILAPHASQGVASDFPSLTAYQGQIRDPQVQSYLAGITRRFGEPFVLEVNASGARGRGLMATDRINRPDSGVRPLPLPDISLRTNAGASDYDSLMVVLRLRTRVAQFRAAYTWSHAIDNQTDPLASDFFSLDFTRVTVGSGSQELAAFSRQGDARADRGNTNFDQRHNVVFFGSWELPRPLGGWRLSGIAAARSGLPYSVFSGSDSSTTGAEIVNNRATQSAFAPADAPVPGGRALLLARNFSPPPPGQLGSTGRNAFRGPGLFSMDVSVSRRFHIPGLPERFSATVRADAFNLLNHANLNNPDSFLDSPTFGQALYGRQSYGSNFPGQAPIDESPRQVQILLRLDF